MILNFSPTKDDQKRKQFGRIATGIRIKWLKKNGQRTEVLIIGVRITLIQDGMIRIQQ